MESNNTQPAKPIPDELIDQLHKANEHFHDARKNLESQMDNTDNRRDERVAEANKGVLAAEQEVEAVSEKIGDELHRGDSSTAKESD